MKPFVMKPFDLDAALKGAKVITRSRLPVTNIKPNPSNSSNIDYPIVATIGGWSYSFTKEGRFYSNIAMNDFDLLMDEPMFTIEDIRKAFFAGVKCTGDTSNIEEQYASFANNYINTITNETIQS